MNDFSVTAAQSATRRTTAQAEVVRFSRADQECLAQALLSPPKQVPALTRAFVRRGELLKAE